jgi:tetrahydrodipicolinate N-succinyltransferase
MTDTPETDAAEWGITPNDMVVRSGLARKLERERDEALALLASEKSTRNHIVKEAIKTEYKRDMYQRQADYLIEQLGETQIRIIDAERICKKIYMARNITLSEESMLSALAEIDKRYRTQHDGN